MHNGTTLTCPSILNIIDFSYMTGRPGEGPMFPNPRIDVPSVRIAFNLDVAHSIIYFYYKAFFKFVNVKYF